MHNLRISVEKYLTRIARQATEELRYQSYLERISSQAKELSGKTSHLQERQNKVSLKRDLQARKQTNAVKKVRSCECQYHCVQL